MTELSPAAQAVLDAYGEQVGGSAAITSYERRGIAAALRALADHQRVPMSFDGPNDWWDPDDRTRRELRNLATELKGGHG